MRISDWSSDVCSSDLATPSARHSAARARAPVLPSNRTATVVHRPWRQGDAGLAPVIFGSGSTIIYLFPVGRCRVSTALPRLEFFASIRSGPARYTPRSEEHTSELQSLMRISYAVFCLTKKQ